MLGPKRPFWPSSPVVARFWGKPEGRSRVYQPTHHLYKMVGTLANTRPCPQRHQPPCSAHVHAPSHAHAQTPLGPTAPVAGLLCGLAVRLHCLSHCLSHTCRIYYVAPLPPTPQACLFRPRPSPTPKPEPPLHTTKHTLATSASRPTLPAFFRPAFPPAVPTYDYGASHLPRESSIACRGSSSSTGLPILTQSSPPGTLPTTKTTTFAIRPLHNNYGAQRRPQRCQNALSLRKPHCAGRAQLDAHNRHPQR